MSTEDFIKHYMNKINSAKTPKNVAYCIERLNRVRPEEVSEEVLKETGIMDLLFNVRDMCPSGVSDLCKIWRRAAISRRKPSSEVATENSKNGPSGHCEDKLSTNSNGLHRPIVTDRDARKKEIVESSERHGMPSGSHCMKNEDIKKLKTCPNSLSRFHSQSHRLPLATNGHFSQRSRAESNINKQASHVQTEKKHRLPSDSNGRSQKTVDKTSTSRVSDNMLRGTFDNADGKNPVSSPQNFVNKKDPLNIDPLIKSKSKTSSACHLSNNEAESNDATNEDNWPQGLEISMVNDGENNQPENHEEAPQPACKTYQIEMQEGMFKAVKIKNTAKPFSAEGQKNLQILWGDWNRKEASDKRRNHQRNGIADWCQKMDVVAKKSVSGSEEYMCDSAEVSGLLLTAHPVSSSSNKKAKGRDYENSNNAPKATQTSTNKIKDKPIVEINKINPHLNNLSTCHKNEKNISLSKKARKFEDQQVSSTGNLVVPPKIKKGMQETSDCTVSKRERRAVYSGRKNTAASEPPRLKEITMKKIQKNPDLLKCYGEFPVYGEPYDALRPILEHLSPMKLLKLEESTKLLSGITDPVWKCYTEQEFKPKISLKSDSVSWKNFYLSCLKEKNNRLKTITASIYAASSNAKPDRQTKLTVLDGPLGPPAKRLKVSSPPVGKATVPMATSKSISPLVSQKSVAPVAGLRVTHVPSSKSITPVVTVAKSSMKETRPAQKSKKDAPLMSKVKKTINHLSRMKKS